MKLSAVVIIQNEEKNLESCLSSLAFADEIVVLDSGSTDRSLEIAGRYTKKVYRRAFDDFASQKNYAADQASGDWLLSVDADERVTVALAQTVKHAAASGGCAAYAIPRQTRLFGRVFRFSGLQKDRPVRLFQKNRARFRNAVHECLEVDGRTGLLKERLEHESFQTFSEYWRRLQQYTALEALRPVSKARMRDFWLRPPARFFRLYIAEQGFRDGREGFYYAILSAYYEFVRWAKIWEAGIQ